MLYPRGIHVTLKEVKRLSVSGGVLQEEEVLLSDSSPRLRRDLE
jgi:hypothetical protein